MPRDSSGNYSRTNGTFTGPTTWQQQANSADKIISSSRHDTHDQDIAGALTDSLDRQGRGAMLANLAMGNFRVTSVADGVASGDAVNKGQLDAQRGWRLIDTQTPSAATQAIFSTGITSAYAYFIFEIVKLRLAAGGATLRGEVSDDGGGTWKTGASDYSAAIGRQDDGNAAMVSSIASPTQAFLALSGGANAFSSTFSLTGTLELRNPADAAEETRFVVDVQGNPAGGLPKWQRDAGVSVYLGTQAINAVRIFPSTSNFTGTIRLWGLFL